MFQRILLPIDLNHPESWEKALPMARHLTENSGTIHLLGIVHDVGMAMVASYLPDGFEKKAMETLKVKLTEFAEREMKDSSRTHVHVGLGHVAEAILRIATEIDADLIIMASHPPNDLQTLLVGSSAGKVVRHADRPVLVVR